MAKHNIDEQDDRDLFVERTVRINRVSKVVKGGRRFSFSALVVAGDGKGRVGYGLGKASEVPDAIRKATEQARRRMKKIPLIGSTIPFEVLGSYGPTTVLLKPAGAGTGVIAGSAARAIAEAVGVTDIRTKCIGSNNPHNILHAVMDGLSQLRDPHEVCRMRGKTVEEVEYEPY